MKEKTCFKCNKSLPLSEFYKHPKMADGHLGKCRECACADVRENRMKRHAYYSSYERKRFSRPERKSQIAKSRKGMRERSPEKYKARYGVSNAIRSGKLKRLPCEACGKEKAEAHHEDYNAPLDVRWLCFKCHREEHGQTVSSKWEGATK